MNIGRVASVRQRLRNLARERGVDYNRLQLLYMQERWLARLGYSPHRDNLILKGGLYLYSNFGLTSRPTRDIDFWRIQLAIAKVFVEPELRFRLHN